MADQVIWSKDSILQVGADTPSSISNATIQGSNINLQSGALVEYDFPFNTEASAKRTESLQLSIRAQAADTSLENRPAENLYIDLNIRYWEEDSSVSTGFKPGPWTTIRCYPYLQSEREGYIAQIVVNIKTQYIHTLQLIFNTSDTSGNITVMNPTLKYAISLSEAIGDLGGDTKLPISIDAYEGSSTEGMVGYYQDDDQPFVIKVENITTNAYLLTISGKATMQFTIHKGDLPWA